MEMTWLEIAYFVIALIIMIIGLFGTILPIIPGTPIILIAAVIYALLTDFQDITNKTLIILAVMTGISLLMDWLTSSFGVKKMGGSYFGVIGAAVGMIVGLLIPGVGLIGFIVGAFVGAFVFELFLGKTRRKGYSDNEIHTALKAGLGTFIGFLVGGVLKFALAAIMIGIFVYRVLVE